ncbi:MAG: hypothetical protein QM802_02215 [Agriterribacter sp.]
MPGFFRMITFLFATIFSAVTSFAQRSYPKHELEFSYGVFPVPEIKGATNSIFATSTTSNEVDRTPGTGSFMFAYNVYLSKRFAMGVTGLYDKVTVSYKNVVSKLNWNITAVMLNAKYNYVYDPRFHMYSGLSAGYAADWANSGTLKERHNVFAYQARIIGVRFGTTVGGFAEVGVGYEGVVKAGLSLQL